MLICGFCFSLMEVCASKQLNHYQFRLLTIRFKAHDSSLFRIEREGGVWSCEVLFSSTVARKVREFRERLEDDD